MSKKKKFKKVQVIINEDGKVRTFNIKGIKNNVHYWMHRDDFIESLCNNGRKVKIVNFKKK